MTPIATFASTSTTPFDDVGPIVQHQRDEDEEPRAPESRVEREDQAHAGLAISASNCHDTPDQ